MDMNALVKGALSLDDETICRATGQYFCNLRPFSLPRTGNRVSILKTGKDVLRNVHDAMMAAESFIWIADWQMALDVELVRRGDADHPGQLHKVIELIISTKPVQVRVLLFGSIHDTIPGTYDGLVADKLNNLNKRGYPGSVKVLLQYPTSSQKDKIDYSHHQKFVVVDGRIGFIGGIDLSYGRWETAEFDVVVDPERFVINEMYSPGMTKLRSTTTLERKKIEEYGFEEPYGGKLIDEGCQPRMPWQDVHIKIEGPSVVDIHRNFVRRWNALSFATRGGVAALDKKFLQKIGAWSRLAGMQLTKAGGAEVQIVRSASRSHLAGEGSDPDDLQLYTDKREKGVWNECLKAWSGTHQANILNAVLNCIARADNYIYIETQFFISDFGYWKGEPSKEKNGNLKDSQAFDSSKIGNEDNGIKNGVASALAARICQHIQANTPFHVYLVIPTHPEGDVTSGATWKQHWLALVTIKHGSSSLINSIKRELKIKRRDPEEWVQYLTVLNMRNHGATVQYGRDPKTFDEHFDCEIGRFVVTEQIYIHSKLMIVDDAVAIVGSANTNDRSLTGNGDTEIAAVVVDTDGVELRDLGSPTMKVQTRKFARELRQHLWNLHFGFLAESNNENDSKYFRSTLRAARNQARVLEKIEHPPRLKTTESKIKKITGVDWQTLLDQPCAPAVVNAIQQIALHNAGIYEKVFQHTPRNSMKTFDVGASLYTQPYTAVFAATRAGPVGEVGVVPPALQPAFMTALLLPHQRASSKDASYSKRYQLYSGSKVHDVTKALVFLKENIVGFFVAAPLDWGMGTTVDNNPTKTGTVDIASTSQMNKEREGATG